jgi:hypothetical protein
MLDMSRFRKGALVILVLGAFLASPGEAQAQRWLQTAQLIVPVKSDSPTKALLDTLVQVIERKDSIKVRRTADSDTQMSISDLRDELISGAGIGLSSANQMFIDYKFMIGNRGYEESFEAFQFLYRPMGQGEADTQMLYIDANSPWVQNVLRNKGTTLRSNQAALKTFTDQLAFARMQGKEGAQVVEIANQAVRSGFERKKRKLVEKITRLTYGSM